MNWFKSLFKRKPKVYTVNINIKIENGPPKAGRHSETFADDKETVGPVDSRDKKRTMDPISTDIFTDADAPEVDFGEEIN